MVMTIDERNALQESKNRIDNIIFAMSQDTDRPYTEGLASMLNDINKKIDIVLNLDLNSSEVCMP